MSNRGVKRIYVRSAYRVHLSSLDLVQESVVFLNHCALTGIRITKDHRPLGWDQESLSVAQELHAGRHRKIVSETNLRWNRETLQLTGQAGLNLLE
jgi:hypothetical protein